MKIQQHKDKSFTVAARPLRALYVLSLGCKEPGFVAVRDRKNGSFIVGVPRLSLARFAH